LNCNGTTEIKRGERRVCYFLLFLKTITVKAIAVTVAADIPPIKSILGVGLLFPDSVGLSSCVDSGEGSVDVVVWSPFGLSSEGRFGAVGYPSVSSGESFGLLSDGGSVVVSRAAGAPR
jgi:hypothetical protein